MLKRILNFSFILPWCFIVSFFINLQVRTGDVVVAAVGVPEMVKVSGSTHHKQTAEKEVYSKNTSIYYIIAWLLI